MVIPKLGEIVKNKKWEEQKLLPNAPISFPSRGCNQRSLKKKYMFGESSIQRFLVNTGSLFSSRRLKS